MFYVVTFNEFWHLLGHYCHLYGKIKQNQVFWQPFCFYVDIWKCPMLTESQQLTCWNWWSKEAKSIKKQTIVNKNKVDWAGCWTKATGLLGIQLHVDCRFSFFVPKIFIIQIFISTFGEWKMQIMWWKKKKKNEQTNTKNPYYWLSG